MKNNVAMPALLIMLVACQKVPETVDPAVAIDAPAPHPGESVYLDNCASCHDKAVYKTPSRLFISMMGARNVLSAMNGGLMAEQAAGLDDVNRKAIAEFLTGQNPDDVPPDVNPPLCDSQHAFDAGDCNLPTRPEFPKSRWQRLR